MNIPVYRQHVELSPPFATGLLYFFFVNPGGFVYSPTALRQVSYTPHSGYYSCRPTGLLCSGRG